MSLKSIYYFNAQSALRASLIPTQDMLFYDGTKIESSPKNCINVPIDNFTTYFLNSQYPYPQELNFDGMDFSQAIQNQISQNIIDTIINIKTQKLTELNDLLRKKIIENDLLLLTNTIFSYVYVNNLSLKEVSSAITKKLLEIVRFLIHNKISLNLNIDTSLYSDDTSLLALHLRYAVQIINAEYKQFHSLTKQYFKGLAEFENIEILITNFELIKTLYPEETLLHYVTSFSHALLNNDFLNKSTQQQKQIIFKIYYLTHINYPIGKNYKEIFHILYPVYETALKNNLNEVVFYLYTPLLFSWGAASQTQEEFKVFNNLVEKKLEDFIRNQIIPKYSINQNIKILDETKPIKVAFLQDRIIDTSVNTVFYSLIKSLQENKSKKYEFIIYNLNYMEFGGSDAQKIDELVELGFKYVDLHNKYVDNTNVFYSIIEKSLKIRERLINDNIYILIGLNTRPEYNFLFTTRTAAKQIYWSHGNDEYNLENIDTKISMFNKTDSRFKFFEIPRNIDKYNPNIDMQEVSKVRGTFSKDAFILGSIGRLIKVDSDVYLEAVAQIMKKNPNTIYLACGSGDNLNIKQKVQNLNIADRFYFTGHVDPHIYGHIIDLWLSPFPFGGGEALEEYRYKGKPYVILFNNSHDRKEGEDLKQLVDEIRNSRSKLLLNSLYSRENLINLDKYGYINPINKQSQSYITLSFTASVDDYINISNEYINNKILRNNVVKEYLHYMESRHNLEITNNSFYKIIEEL